MQWLEYEGPAPYDHATMLVFDGPQERQLRHALGLYEGDDATESAVAARFKTYWDVKAFANDAKLTYERKMDFNP